MAGPRRCSRRHARILVRDEGAVIQDIGSKNGTRVMEAPATDAVALSDGDRVAFGPVVGLYRRARGGMTTETTLAPPG